MRTREFMAATKALADEPQVDEDAVRLREILRMDPSELCKRQCHKL